MLRCADKLHKDVTLQVFRPNLQASDEKHKEEGEPREHTNTAHNAAGAPCCGSILPKPPKSEHPPLQLVPGEEEIVLEEVLKNEST